jgi:hypothetical protein
MLSWQYCTLLGSTTPCGPYPGPCLESLTRAFRKRFQVPEAAVTIADRISQKCHQDWIEAFLVQHQTAHQAR